MLTQSSVILPTMDNDSPPGGDADSPTSAFIFVGINTTLTNFVDLNLEDIPTNFIPPISNSTLGNITSPHLVSALICDPQLHLAPTTVTLSNGLLQAMTRSGPPLVKNILPKAANVIFSQSLLMATSTMNMYGDANTVVNSIARILFLTDPSFEYDNNPAGIKPLSNDRINEKMNAVIQSSAKAFLSGYWLDDRESNNLTFPSFETIETNATAEMQHLALTGSRPFILGLVVVVCVLILLLGFLVAGVKAHRLLIFDLGKIVKALSSQ